MAGFLFCIPALHVLLVQGLPLDTFTTASQAVAYGLPQQYAGKSSVWDGNARSTNCPYGVSTGGSCYLRDEDEPTPSTLYQPEAPTPVSSLTSATSYVNGTRSEDCTTGENSKFYSTYAPVETYSSSFQTRPQVTRTGYSQQSSEFVPSQPYTSSSDITSRSQGQYTVSNIDNAFSNETISTTWDASRASLSSGPDISHLTVTYSDSQYSTALATVTASRSPPYGPTITTWTDLPTFTFTDVVIDPAQTMGLTSESVTVNPTPDDLSTNSYFYGQPLPSMTSIYDYGSSTRDPYASQSPFPQSTLSQHSVYADPEFSNTFSLRPTLTRPSASDIASSRQTLHPDPTSSFTMIRDPIITASEFSYTARSQRTVYPDSSVSFTVFPEPSASQTDLSWSTHTEYPGAGVSNTIISVNSERSSSNTFIWDPTLPQTGSLSRHTGSPEPSISNTFTQIPTLTQTETWSSQYTADPEPSSSNQFSFDQTVATRSTSWIYPTAYWQPTSDRSGSPTATPVRDPNAPDTTFVTVTKTAFPTISSGSDDGLPSYHHYAGAGWPFDFWHRLSRSFSSDHGHEVASWKRDRDIEHADKW